MQHAIETHALTKMYGRPVVDGIDLRVRAGCVTGFLGPNGAGKTTTIRMLLGLIQPSAGRISMLGLAMPRARRRIARQVGALVETPCHYDNLTGRENLEITRRLLGERPSEIDRVLGRADLDFAAGQRVGTYSLGMRQRLGIARALIGQPRLLILDEPTNGLDPDGIAEVRRFIRKLPDEGVTVLLSSHLLAEVEQTVDEVALLHGGRLLAQGPLLDILAGTGEHLIAEVSDTDRALAVLRKNGVGAVPLGARVEIADVRMPPAEINRLLVNSGIAISELRRERPSLETVYMRQTENQARAREAA